MTKFQRYRLGCFASLMLFAIPIRTLAHHGIGAQFDLSQMIEFQGDIRQLIWRNPHVRFTIAADDANGEESLWLVEAQSITSLRQRDITDVLFSVGDRITLAGNPAYGGDTELYATNVLLPDGREVLFSQNAEPRWRDAVIGNTGPRYATAGDSSAPDLGIFRVWSARGPSIWRNFDFETHPLSDTARAEGEAWDNLTDRPGLGECAPPPMPEIVAANPYPREFVDQDDAILMRLEHYDTVRTIHLSPLPPDAEPGVSALGYSVGHWEGDSFVVTTNNISEGRFRLGISLSDELQVVERYTLSDDGSRLDFELTLTDPSVLLEPLELATYWLYLPTVTVEPFDCVEGL